MKYLFILLLLLNSCVIKKNDNPKNVLNINFDKSMSYQEFKLKVNEYAENKPYPNFE